MAFRRLRGCRCASLAVALGLLVALPNPDSSAKDAERIFAKVQSSIVTVRTREAFGSGVVVGKELVVTNCHVVADAPEIMVRRLVLKNDKTYEFRAEMAAADVERDLCLLHVRRLSGSPALREAKLGSAAKSKVGAEVVAIGAPQGLELSLSRGIISQLRQRSGSPAPVIQTDAAISPGSSGGGLFNTRGELIGIMTYSRTQGQNLNFAMPAEWVRELIRKR